MPGPLDDARHRWPTSRHAGIIGISSGRLSSGRIRRMLLGLTIRDIVLIDRLALAFRPGLCVLTG
ncbi:MAG: hypothetical protein ACREFB_05470, partial [Stellaceae bacterium]